MTPRTWADGPQGHTPITAAALNAIEADIVAAANSANASVKTINGISPDSSGNLIDPSTATNLEGVPLYIYGNSYTVSPPMANRATTGAEWPQRVKNRLRMGAISSNGLGGSVLPHTYYELNNNVSGGTPSRAWLTGSKGLVVVEETINDVVTFGNNSNAFTAYQNALRAIVESVRAATRIDATNGAFTYTGTWSTGTTYLKASGKKTSTVGDKVVFSVVGDECTLYVMGYSAAGPTVTVTATGISPVVVDLSNQMAPYNAPGSVGNGITSNIVPIRIKGLGSGTNSVTLTLTTTGTVYFDGVSIPGTKSPQVIFLKEGTINNYNPNGSDNLRVQYNNLAQAVANEYPAIMSIADPGAAWVPATCLYMGDGTGNHPNDRGHAVLADAVIAAVAKLGYRDGMNIL